MSAKKATGDARDQRLAELKKALNVIDPESVINLDNEAPSPIEKLSTRITEIDAILGGGVPYGRIVEVFGNEASGKTTLCSHIAASAQVQGSIVTYLDVENAYDLLYAQALGVDVTAMAFAQPSSAEKTFDLAVAATETGVKGDVIIIDSMAALVPQAELEGEMSDQQMAAQARVIGKGLRKLIDLVSTKKMILICINQLREKMNTMGWGEKETTPGGRALKFWASQRIQLITVGKLKTGEGKDKEVEGQEVLVKVVKSKVFKPFMEARVPLYFGKGFSALESLLHFAIAKNMIQQDGKYYTLFSYDEQGHPVAGTENRLCGMEAVKEHFTAKPEELAKLNAVVQGRMFL